MAEIPDFTPVNLLTGFLGSGKTTLLARLLADPALADTAVLINEFGEVGLDHELIERIDETMVLMQSGCLCCTIRGELSAAIKTLHSKRARGLVPPFRRLVVESTGLADPFPILSTIKADPVLRHHFRLGNVVATVDAVNGLASLDRHAESVRQAAVADRLVLTKTDLADATATARLVARVRGLNPVAPILDAAAAAPDADALFVSDVAALAGPAVSEAALFAASFVGEAAEGEGAARHDHDHAAPERDRHGAIRAFAITLDAPIDWTAFGIWLTMLLNRHGERVLRIKGILDLAGEDRPVAVHGVQHLVHPPVHMGGWPPGPRRSRLVFIVDGLDPAPIRRSFAAFNRLAAPVLG